MNSEPRKPQKDKQILSSSVDTLVYSIKAYIEGDKMKSKDIKDALEEFNIYSNIIMEDLRKQRK